MEPSILLLFAGVGAMAGTLAGLMGVGGGIVYVPVLVYFMGLQGFDPAKIPTYAVATSLATILFTILSSAINHYRKGNLDVPSLPQLAVGGIGGAFLASLLLMFFNAISFTFLLGFLQLYLGAKLYTQAPKAEGGKGSLVGIGAFAGTISGFFGVGGGLYVTPFLHVNRGFTLIRSVGTASGFMLMSIPFSLASYMVQGMHAEKAPEGVWNNIYLPAFFAILPSSMLFSWLAAGYGAKLNEKKLKKAFGLFVLTLGLYGMGRALFLWAQPLF